MVDFELTIQDNPTPKSISVFIITFADLAPDLALFVFAQPLLLEKVFGYTRNRLVAGDKVCQQAVPEHWLYRPIGKGLKRTVI